MVFVKFVLFKNPLLEELKLGKPDEDGAEKLVGIAERDALPVKEGAELIDEFAEELSGKLGELVAVPRYGAKFGQSIRPQTELPLVSL